MTSTITLEAEKREKTSKGKGEKIPAILYGKGIKNSILWVGEKEFNKIIEQVGESTIFKVSVGQNDQRNVLIKEIQRDILNGRPIHVDFYQVRMDEEIETMVELEFVGESPVVKESGGVLVKNMDEIEVKCLPGNLPSKIEVDISRMKTFDDYIYVKDLPIPEKVEISVDPETVVAMVSEPRSEEELAELDTEVKEDVTQVEGVVKEEKPAEEGKEAGAEAETKIEPKEEKKEKK